MEQLCPMLQLRVCTGDKHPPAVHRHPASSVTLSKDEPRSSAEAGHTSSVTLSPEPLSTHTGHPVQLPALLLRDDVVQQHSLGAIQLLRVVDKLHIAVEERAP